LNLVPAIFKTIAQKSRNCQKLSEIDRFLLKSKEKGEIFGQFFHPKKETETMKRGTVAFEDKNQLLVFVELEIYDKGMSSHQTFSFCCNFFISQKKNFFTSKFL
jgi:hypothetical protein